MPDDIEISSNTRKKDEISKMMSEIEIHPVFNDSSIEKDKDLKIPFSQISTIGVAFEPLKAIFEQAASSSAGASGLYRVTIKNGGKLAQFKDGSGYLGSVLKENGAVGGGQAILNPINPIAFNPTMLFMAMTLVNIERKLDTIQEMQQELLDFLVQKERSELKGDLIFLADVFNNFKYNWNNEKYKNNNHIKVLDIRQAAEGKIDFYKEQITAKINKKSFFHSDQEVKKQLTSIQSEFKDYQLALYLYSFSSFLEVLLLENYIAAYLDGIIGKICDYASTYRDLYSKCYEQIEGYSKTSIESGLIKGLASVSKKAGIAINKVPGINKSQIDEKLVESGNWLGNFGMNRTEKTMKRFIEAETGCVQPFIENIQIINQIYNKPVELLFDHENLYIEAPPISV